MLKRVESGERIVVTSHDKPIAELTPLRGRKGTIQHLIDEGRATPASGPLTYDPVRLEDLAATTLTASAALEIERGERRTD